MKNSQTFFEQLIAEFATVGKQREDIKAAYIIGSRARKKCPADQWSDLDILIYTDEPHYYLESSEFIAQFGNIWSSFPTKTLGNDPERLTLFEGGHQVDLVVKTGEEYQKQLASGETPWLFKRGVQLILDNQGQAAELLPKKTVIPEKMPLNEPAFTQVNQMFWFVTMYISKQLLREDLWSAKAREMDYKNILLQMIEWYEQSLHGIEYDTWHGGRFISEWAEPEVYEALFDIFGGFDLESSWQALIHSVDLFAQLAEKTAELNHFTYDKALQENIKLWLSEHQPV
ncbi:aminoglycoside 6-adenylyltransferase [Enterococcus sp. LJL128]